MLLTRLVKKMLTMGLITSMVGSFAPFAQAQDQFDQNNISFRQDSIVEFEFISSNGSNQSAFGVLNITTGEETIFFQEIKPYDNFNGDGGNRGRRGQYHFNQDFDYLGTIGNAVLPGANATIVPYPNKPNGSVVEFLFKKNEIYLLFLDSKTPTGQVNRRFLSTQNYLQLDGDLAGGNMRDRYGRNIVGLSLTWEDGGERNYSDLDFDDFVVEAGGVLRESYSRQINLPTQSFVTQRYYYSPYYYYNQHQRQPMYYYYQPHYLY